MIDKTEFCRLRYDQLQMELVESHRLYYNIYKDEGCISTYYHEQHASYSSEMLEVMSLRASYINSYS